MSSNYKTMGDYYALMCDGWDGKRYYDLFAMGGRGLLEEVPRGDPTQSRIDHIPLHEGPIVKADRTAAEPTELGWLRDEGVLHLRDLYRANPPIS